jgi:hypothetical protein
MDVATTNRAPPSRTSHVRSHLGHLNNLLACRRHLDAARFDRACSSLPRAREPRFVHTSPRVSRAGSWRAKPAQLCGACSRSACRVLSLHRRTLPIVTSRVEYLKIAAQGGGADEMRGVFRLRDETCRWSSNRRNCVQQRINPVGQRRSRLSHEELSLRPHDARSRPRAPTER